MNAKIQELTQSIYQEGVEKARSEGRSIVEAAQEEARSVLEAARAEAERLRAATAAEIEMERQKSLTELRQAGAHAMEKFMTELSTALERSALAQPLEQAFGDPQFLASLLRSLVANWTSPDSVPRLAADLPEGKKTELESWFAAQGKDLLDKGLVLRFDGRFADGFRIGPVEGTWQVSFTSKDAASLFQTYLKTRTRELLFPLA